jgi:hypothetical protein
VCIAFNSADTSSTAAFNRLADQFANPQDPTKQPQNAQEVTQSLQRLDATQVETLLASNPYARISRTNARDALDTMTAGTGGASTSTWGASQLTAARKVLPAMNTTEIQSLPAAAVIGDINVNGQVVPGALQAVGTVEGYTKEQATAWAGKLISAIPGGIAAATNDTLREAGSVLQGLTGDQIKNISASAWPGARSSFQKVAKTRGSMDATQQAAVRDRVKADLPNIATASADDVKVQGALMGTLTAAELGQVPAAALPSLSGDALAIAGPTKVAQAFDATQLAAMSPKTRETVNGADLQQFSKAEQRALVAGSTTATVGAVVDVTLVHDEYTTAETLQARVQTAIGAVSFAGQTPNVTKVQDSQRLAVATRRRRGLTTTNDLESVVRMVTDTSADADAAATAAAPQGVVTKLTIDASTTPSPAPPPAGPTIAAAPAFASNPVLFALTAVLLAFVM